MRGSDTTTVAAAGGGSRSDLLASAEGEGAQQQRREKTTRRRRSSKRGVAISSAHPAPVSAAPWLVDDGTRADERDDDQGGGESLLDSVSRFLVDTAEPLVLKKGTTETLLDSVAEFLVAVAGGDRISTCSRPTDESDATKAKESYLASLSQFLVADSGDESAESTRLHGSKESEGYLASVSQFLVAAAGGESIDSSHSQLHEPGSTVTNKVHAASHSGGRSRRRRSASLRTPSKDEITTESSIAPIDESAEVSSTVLDEGTGSLRNSVSIKKKHKKKHKRHSHRSGEESESQGTDVYRAYSEIRRSRPSSIDLGVLSMPVALASLRKRQKSSRASVQSSKGSVRSRSPLVPEKHRAESVTGSVSITKAGESRDESSSELAPLQSLQPSPVRRSMSARSYTCAVSRRIFEETNKQGDQPKSTDGGNKSSAQSAAKEDTSVQYEDVTLTSAKDSVALSKVSSTNKQKSSVVNVSSKKYQVANENSQLTQADDKLFQKSLEPDHTSSVSTSAVNHLRGSSAGNDKTGSSTTLKIGSFFSSVFGKKGRRIN